MEKLKYMKLFIAYLIIFIIPSMIWAQSNISNLDPNLLQIMHNTKKMLLPSDTKQTGEIDKQTGTYIISFIGSDETGQYVDKIRFDKTGAFLEIVSPHPVPERIYGRLAKIGVSPKGSDKKAPDAEVKAEPVSDKIYLPIEILERPNLIKILPVAPKDISPDGKLLISYRGELLDMATYKTLAVLPECIPLRFSPDGKIISAYSGKLKSIIFWDIEKIWDSGKAEKLNTLIPVHDDDGIFDAIFSPDGKLFAFAENNYTLKLYDIATGKKIWTFKHNQVIFSIDFSPDGKLFAIASGDVVAAMLIDVRTGKEIKRLRYPNDDEDGKVVSFSPDGKLLATSGDKYGLWDIFSPILWDVATGRIIKGLPYKAGYVVFSPDGKFLVTSTSIKISAEPIRYQHIVKLYDVVKDKEFLLVTCLDSYPHIEIISGKLIRINNLIYSRFNDIAEFFKKDEFETTNEYMQRVKGVKFPYSTNITLGRYDADRSGFEIEIQGIKAFIPVEREKAKVIAASRDRLVYIRGNLIFACEGMLELVDAQLMFDSTNEQ